MPFETSNSAVVHVVDDDAALRGAWRACSTRWDLTPEPTEPLATFLTRALRISPDASVIDIRLPDMSGLEFQAQLTQLGFACR